MKQVYEIEESEKCRGKNPGLWCNIHQRRRDGKPKKKRGQKGYPKTLDLDEATVAVARAVGLTLSEAEEIIFFLDEMCLEDVSLFFNSDQRLFEKKKPKCKGSESAPVGSPRQRSFCKRMCGHKKKNTGSKTASDPDSCIRQALRRWKCRCQ